MGRIGKRKTSVKGSTKSVVLPGLRRHRQKKVSAAGEGSGGILGNGSRSSGGVGGFRHYRRRDVGGGGDEGLEKL